MKVRELIELNQMIVDAEITIRENGSALLDQLNIGLAEGVKPPQPFRVPRRPEYKRMFARNDDQFYKDAAYITKSINSWDDGKDYWQVKINRIPAKWLDLEVFAWEVWPASTVHVPHRYRNVNFHGQRINIVALPSGQVMEIKQEPKNEHDEQIEGQMNLADFIGETE